MMTVANKVGPIKTIDIETKELHSNQFKEFASNPESQKPQKNEISQPTSDQLNFFTYENIRPSSQQALAQESQITQENGISFLHYFSWLSDIFLSIASTGLWIIIPTHNMLEKPSYW